MPDKKKRPSDYELLAIEVANCDGSLFAERTAEAIECLLDPESTTESQQEAIAGLMGMARYCDERAAEMVRVMSRKAEGERD